MKRADPVVTGEADLVCMQTENETLVLDLLFRSEGDPLARPLTVWVARPSDYDLTWVAERHLHEWALVGSDIALAIQLSSEEPRVHFEDEEIRITFQLVGCAGLP